MERRWTRGRNSGQISTSIAIISCRNLHLRHGRTSTDSLNVLKLFTVLGDAYNRVDAGIAISIGMPTNGIAVPISGYKAAQVGRELRGRPALVGLFDQLRLYI